MATRTFSKTIENRMTIFTTTVDLLNGDITETINTSNFENLFVQLRGTAGVGLSVNYRGSADGINFNTINNVTSTGISGILSSSMPVRMPYFRAEVVGGDGTTDLILSVVAYRGA